MISNKKRKTLDIETEEQQEQFDIIEPKCVICLHEYTNRTFLRPCYHSFCFQCIRHWINMASSACPVCRQTIQSLVYNIDDEANTFDEYHLKDKASHEKQHNPQLYKKNPYISPEDRLRHQRIQVYKGLVKAERYPEPLPRHINFTVITPEYIPRTRVFLQNELKAIVGTDCYDTFLEDHFIKILLTPYQCNSDKLKMQDKDQQIIQTMAEWLDDDRQVAAILLKELIAYLKSGLAYKTFISSVIYE